MASSWILQGVQVNAVTVRAATATVAVTASGYGSGFASGWSEYHSNQ